MGSVKSGDDSQVG